MATMTPSYRRLHRSLRLTFRFAGDRITLVDRREVEMRAVPSDPLEQPTDRSGFWIEVQDSARRAIYRRGMRHPLRLNSEVVGEDGRLTNVVSVAERGAFSLVVPNLPDGVELTLVATPADLPENARPAAEILRVALGGSEPHGTHPTDSRG